MRLLLAAVVALPATTVEAAPTPRPRPRTQTVVAGEQYEAGAFWSFFFGKDYRDLWTQPIQVPVLDLDRFAGGLTARKDGGRRQTRTLQFDGRNGREYKFRSLDKDPAAALPNALRTDALEYLVRDQTSSGHPAADLVVEPLLRAAGVLHAHRRLVVLPDSPRLGRFRGEFAGMLGTIEDDPEKKEPERTPGFETITRIVDSDELDAILASDSAERVDVRAYLRARLLDVYLGDWDRHREQWDWGKSRRDGRWKPIPNDRDQAFSRFDGVLAGLVSRRGQSLGNFGEKYDDLLGTQRSGRDMDRRFLSGLEEAVWTDEARDLARRLTDAVIAEAVGRMPPEYHASNGARLTRTLKARRDGLPAMAGGWYHLLAKQVDVFGTDQDDSLHVNRTARGFELTLAPKRGGAPLVHRRFHEGETERVCVHLEAGDDSARVQGHGPIALHVIGGLGADLLDDTAGGHTHFHDASGADVVRHGPGTKREGQEGGHRSCMNPRVEMPTPGSAKPLAK